MPKRMTDEKRIQLRTWLTQLGRLDSVEIWGLFAEIDLLKAAEGERDRLAKLLGALPDRIEYMGHNPTCKRLCSQCETLRMAAKMVRDALAATTKPPVTSG